MNITNTTKCPACDYKRETVPHFNGHCPAYSLIRADCFQTYYTNTESVLQTTYLTNTASPALFQTSEKNTSQELHRIINLLKL